MMEPHFKGKTTSTKPMYSRKLIHPSCIEKHSACGRENTPHSLVCGIIVQVSCTMVFYPYTLENHICIVQLLHRAYSRVFHHLDGL